MPMPDDVTQVLERILAQFGDLLLERRMGGRAVDAKLSRVRQTILAQWELEEQRRRGLAEGGISGIRVPGDLRRLYRRVLEGEQGHETGQAKPPPAAPKSGPRNAARRHRSNQHRFGITDPIANDLVDVVHARLVGEGCALPPNPRLHIALSAIHAELSVTVMSANPGASVSEVREALADVRDALADRFQVMPCSSLEHRLLMSFCVQLMARGYRLPYALVGNFLNVHMLVSPKELVALWLGGLDPKAPGVAPLWDAWTGSLPHGCNRPGDALRWLPSPILSAFPSLTGAKPDRSTWVKEAVWQSRGVLPQPLDPDDAIDLIAWAIGTRIDRRPVGKAGDWIKDARVDAHNSHRRAANVVRARLLAKAMKVIDDLP